jgi:signal transduction histidine kinase
VFKEPEHPGGAVKRVGVSQERPPYDVLPAHPAVWQGLRQLRDADRAHPWLLDGALALFIMLIGLASLFPSGPSDDTFAAASSVTASFVAVTAVAQSLPLIWRRKAPLPVFGIVLAVCVVQVSAGVALRSDISLMIALYGVSRYASLRLPGLICAGAGILTAVILAIVRVPTLAHLHLFGVFFLACGITAPAALGLAARARHAQLTALADRAARMETEREQRVRLATASERARIAREMHDIIGHNVAVIVGLADGAASQALAGHERSAEVLRMIAATGRQALRELRLTLGALREDPGAGPAEPELQPQPGTADLADLIDRIRAAGPQARYITTGDLAGLERGVQLTVYRIVQEALTNSMKYAGTATSLLVKVAVSDSDVQVTVEDSGGPPLWQRAGSEPTGGQGLIGVRERVALAGGTARAGPRPGGGWTVQALLPLPAAREQP